MRNAVCTHGAFWQRGFQEYFLFFLRKSASGKSAPTRSEIFGAGGGVGIFGLDLRLNLARKGGRVQENSEGPFEEKKGGPKRAGGVRASILRAWLSGRIGVLLLWGHP